MGQVRASDCHPALIALYGALQEGWDPPPTVTREDYDRARLLLDSDPLKGFIGFGASFGGRWFGGFARDQDGYDYARGSRRTLLRQFRHLQGVEFECRSFFDVEPGTWQGVIYCDPPYRGTKRYTTGAFDHAGFWDLCRRWVNTGVRVFVSELECPIDHQVRWSIERTWSVARSVQPKTTRDQLFEIVV